MYSPYQNMNLDAARARAQGRVGAAETIGNARRKRGFFQTIGTAIGGIVGGIYGGPAGAAAGGTLGGMALGAASGVNPNVGSSPYANTAQQLTTLGSQLGSYGFSPPPQADVPNLGSSQINPLYGSLAVSSGLQNPYQAGQGFNTGMGRF